MICQRSIKPEIIEDFNTGVYDLNEDINEEEIYQKYLNRYTSVLPYQWGVYVTAYAFRNLHNLGKCIDYENGGHWYYSDTDSIFASIWNQDKLTAYNNECKEKLKRAGYGAVNYNGKEYWLGVATLDKVCELFRYQGAKRYCYKSAEDHELHITVAGVPKKAAAQLKSIDDFAPGFIFSGIQSGKKTHTYFYADSIYTDKNGNVTGDSIDLSPCDYLLDQVGQIHFEDLFMEEVTIQTYD